MNRRSRGFRVGIGVGSALVHGGLWVGGGVRSVVWKEVLFGRKCVGYMGCMVRVIGVWLMFGWC